MEVKDYIIEESDKLFCQYGFKSVTMDDIAKHLGMSKKTIYQHFADKDELVTLLIVQKTSSQGCAMDICSQQSENAVHELFLAFSEIHKMLDQMNPKLFYDLQKYHTKAWLIFRDFREKTLSQAVYKNLERGIEEGFFRADLNKDIITRMRLEQVDLLFNDTQAYTMNTYTVAQVMIEITKHYLYGVSNKKGLEQINKYEEQTQKQA